MNTILKKLLTILCFLVCPVLLYELIVFFIAGLFKVLLLSLEADSAAALFPNWNLPLLYSGIGASLAALILGFLYLSFKKQTGVPSSARTFPVYGYFYVIFLGAAGAIFFNLLLELSRLPELFHTTETIRTVTEASHPMIYFLVVCLIIPVTEELCFRGLGFFHLRRQFSYLTSSLLTALAFGIFHGNAPQTLYGFCMGILLAHTAESCQNLFSLFLFHWSANVVSFSFLGRPAEQTLMYSLPILGLSGIACVWLYYRVRGLKGEPIS